MNECLRFYSGLIEKGLNRAIDSDDRVCRVVKSIQDGKTVIRPAMIEERQLVMPTQKMLGLTSAEWESRMAFHPFCESLSRGESEVIQWLRKEIAGRLNKSIGSLMIRLAELATGSRELSPELARTFTPLKKMDDASVIAICKVFEKSIEKRTYSIVNIYLRRDQLIGEAKYRRVAVVDFPLLDDLLDPENNLFGVKIRKQDRLNMIELLKVILPSSDIAQTYSAGSNNDVAPYLTSLLMAFETLAKVTNTMVMAVAKVDATVEAYQIDVSFMDDFAAAASKHMTIPSLPGNIGKGGDQIGAIAKVNRDLPPTQQPANQPRSRFGNAAYAEPPRRFGGQQETGRRFGGSSHQEEPRFSTPRFGGQSQGLGGRRFSQDRTSSYASGDVEQQSPRFGGSGRFGGGRFR